MYVVIWTYEVADENRVAFEGAYGADGVWSRFFGSGDGYRGTELLRNETGRYVTIDRWQSRDAYEKFVEAHRDAYSDIDSQCGVLTERERFVGTFEGANP